ncbi:Sec-independent protein translocase protein TatB [Salsipaludibacter albus]|uniref:Sec-independent protein translocase protein TatB n=1 Tax=Salsipaludibacter albus TaxID=2849650 RepID=UPI001EE406F9
MDSFGIQEMLVIAVVALVVFGPEKLPELARQAAKWVNRFRSTATSSLDELRKAADLQDLEDEFGAIRDDIRSVRESVTRPLREVTRGDTPRSADHAPPIDLEAT